MASSSATTTCIAPPCLLFLLLIFISTTVLLLGEARPSFTGVGNESRLAHVYRRPLDHQHGRHHGGHRQLPNRDTRPATVEGHRRRHRGGVVAIGGAAAGALRDAGGGEEEKGGSRRWPPQKKLEERWGAAAMGGGAAAAHVEEEEEEEEGGGGGDVRCSPCGEVYVVRDAGETLQTISTLCHVAAIEMDNPHINDYDDLAPGALLFISSTLPRCS